MDWNQQQEAIFEAVADTDRSLVIEARAGTGKTTTIVEAARRLPSSSKTIFVAFNKGIQTELSERLKGSKVECKTLHGVGYATIAAQFGSFDVDGKKINGHIKDAINGLVMNEAKKKQARDAFGSIKRLIGLGKNLLCSKTEGLLNIATAHGLLDDECDPDVLIAVAHIAIASSINEVSRIDFDDMISLPAFHGLTPKRFDVVIVDEAQDVNPAQEYLIEKMARSVRGRSSRVIAVGDDRQAIYQFRGAGDGVLGRLADLFDADRAPLSVTYRCGSKIVAQVKDIVPDYEADPSTGKGTVRSLDGYDKIDPRRGDFVLSRVNAPLIRLALQWIMEGLPATIAGRDIAASLTALVKQSKCATVEDLRAWIPRQADRARRKYKDDEDARAVKLDQLACLDALLEGMTEGEALGAVRARLESLFGDKDDGAVITLSSVHKAKGLERDRVWILRDTFRVGAGNTAEDNIYYVACTRAAKELIEVWA